MIRSVLQKRRSLSCSVANEIHVVVVPEGPLSFDGVQYRYSKGELRYLEELSASFGHITVLALAFRPGDPHYESAAYAPLRPSNLTVVELPMTRGRATILKKAIQFAKTFRIALRVLPKAQLLYFFVPGYPSAVTWLAARLLRKPHIVYAADDWVSASEGMFKWPERRGTIAFRMFLFVNELLERTVAKTALFCVTAGRSLLDKYKGWGVAAYETAPRFTIRESDIVVRDDTCLNDTIELLNVAHLVHDKAQHLLLDALAAIRNRLGKRIHLTIVGEGPRENELRERAQSVGVSDLVTFTGNVQDEETLWKYYRHADVFVLSSDSEGFPRVLYEAMASCLPIVSTEVGGVPALLRDRDEARLVPCGDSGALALAIEEVVADGHLRRRMIQSGARLIRTILSTRNHRQIAALLEANDLIVR